jgi:hypothetical protein
MLCLTHPSLIHQSFISLSSIQAPGLKIWRIEQFHVVPWPDHKKGKFFTGDTYIVLNSYTVGDSDALLHDVHIWIGSESSQDEYGTAAYKMVEADDFLGGKAVQHRQVQGHEAPLFQSYFDYDLTYMEGGTETGFNIVEPTEDTPHLYRVKGTQKGMSLTQVDLSKNSLYEGDAFILIANKGKVWLWNGKSANPDEKAKANSMAENMCTLGTVKTLDQGHGDDEEAEFWAYLGDGEIQEADDLDKVRTEMLFVVIWLFILSNCHFTHYWFLPIFIRNSMWKRLLPSYSSCATIRKQDPYKSPRLKRSRWGSAPPSPCSSAACWTKTTSFSWTLAGRFMCGLARTPTVRKSFRPCPSRMPTAKMTLARPISLSPS